MENNIINQLQKEIRLRNIAEKIFLGGTLVFLIIFLFVPLIIEEERKWIIILIHFAIPFIDVAIVNFIFPLMKPYLLDGILQKCINPSLNERSNKPLMIYNLIYISNAMIFGLAIPVILVLVLLQVSASLMFVWAFLSTNTILAATEYKAKKVLDCLLEEKIGQT